MIRAAALLLLPCLLSAASDDRTGTDKTLHAVAGAWIAQTCDQRKAPAVVKYGLLVLASVGKEVLDRHADRRDALATLAGASITWTWRF